MRVWRGLGEVPEGWGPSSVAMGVFDGVHRGHRVLVSAAVEQARGRGAEAVVVTFDPHPRAVLRPDAAPPLLATLEHRLQLLAELGTDAALVLPFTRVLSEQSPEQFVQDVLVDTLRAAHVVVGADFRFGHRARGDAQLLAELGDERGFTVEALALVGDEQGRISSTTVRSLLAAGDVAGAAALLGRPHRLEGPVVRGDRRGRTLGYPTANVQVAPGAAVPADGVYAAELVLGAGPGAQRLPAALSIGTNPTFAGVERRVEAYVLDRDDLDLYDQQVVVDVLARLRETLHFSSVADLLEQMHRDVEQVRALLPARGRAGERG